MDYQNGKIYTIRSPHTEKYYIGSTTSTLVKRFSEHKTGYKNKKKTMTSKIIFEFGDAYIELLELFPCNSKIELNKREGELQRLHKNEIVNTKFECRTEQERKEQSKEYYMNNSDIIKQQSKEYYMNNSDIIKEQNKEYRKINTEAIKEQRHDYYKKNSDIIKEQKRDYYIKNFEKILKQVKEYQLAKKLLNETILT